MIHKVLVTHNKHKHKTCLLIVTPLCFVSRDKHTHMSCQSIVIPLCFASHDKHTHKSCSQLLNHYGLSVMINLDASLVNQQAC